MTPIQESDITSVLRAETALSGRELGEKLGISYDERTQITYLWALCTASKDIAAKSVARKYMRIDKQRGLLEISPSIPRDFADFTVLGLEQEKLEERAKEIKERARRVSGEKKDSAKTIIDTVTTPLNSLNPKSYFCFLLCGDVTYNMAHDSPREVNGELVRGSDIDLVILHSGDTPPELIKQLDEALLWEKFIYLKQPYREEVDYIIKSISVVERQASMAAPRDSIACKIIRESIVLYGNQELHTEALGFLAETGALEKLQRMEQEALKLRETGEKALLEELLTHPKSSGDTTLSQSAHSYNLIYP